MFKSPKSDVLSYPYFEETDGSTTYNLYKVCTVDDNISLKIHKKSGKQWSSLSDFFMDVFLPHGYPNSVSKDYIQYQLWDSIQAFASSITGAISTHAVLKGAGVGDESATPLAATITWLMKDGTSMIGRIAFAWLQGTKLDSDCKKWRLFADIMNDIATFLDLLSAYFQNNFTLIVCLSGLIKSIVGVAGGSTRAALTQHQARKNNMADVSAKDGSQETLVNLLALMCSFIFIPVVTKSFMLTWITYICMTVVHLSANYAAVSSVVMETFNSARFKIYANHHFCRAGTVKNLLSIDDVNKRENVFFSFRLNETIIKLGCSFKDVVGKSYKKLEQILQLYKECNYILFCDVNKTSIVVKVVLAPGATVLTEIEAMYQACCLDHMLHNGSSNVNEDNILYYVTASRDYTKKKFCGFLESTKEKGFNVDVVYFNTNKWRVDW